MLGRQLDRDDARVGGALPARLTGRDRQPATSMLLALEKLAASGGQLDGNLPDCARRDREGAPAVDDWLLLWLLLALGSGARGHRTGDFFVARRSDAGFLGFLALDDCVCAHIADAGDRFSRLDVQRKPDERFAFDRRSCGDIGEFGVFRWFDERDFFGR